MEDPDGLDLWVIGQMSPMRGNRISHEPHQPEDPSLTTSPVKVGQADNTQT